MATTKLEQELIDASSFRVKRFANRQDYLAALARAVQEIDDDAFDDISNKAVDWFNAACDAINSNEDIADFEEDDEADEPDERDEDEGAPEVDKPDDADDDDDGDEDDEADEDPDEDEEPEPEPAPKVKRARAVKEPEPTIGKIPEKRGRRVEPDPEPEEPEDEEPPKPVKKAKVKAKEPEPEPEPDDDEDETPPPKKAKAKKSTPSEPLDPSAKNRYGYFEGTKTDEVCKMLERGAKMAEMTDYLGGTYYNLIRKLRDDGHSVSKDDSTGKFVLKHKDDVASGGKKAKK